MHIIYIMCIKYILVEATMRIQAIFVFLVNLLASAFVVVVGAVLAVVYAISVFIHEGWVKDFNIQTVSE